MTREKTTGSGKKRLRIILIIVPIVVIFVAIYVSWLGPIIFQEGNPIPYYYAVQKVNSGQPYAQVDGTTGTFITKQLNDPELIAHIEKTWDTDFDTQMGGVLIFSDGDSITYVDIRVFWRKYILLEVNEDLGL